MPLLRMAALAALALSICACASEPSRTDFVRYCIGNGQPANDCVDASYRLYPPVRGEE